MIDQAFTTCLWFGTEAEQAAKSRARTRPTKFDLAALEQAYASKATVP